MTKIQLIAHRSMSNSAWSKAPADVAVIAERAGFEMFDIDCGRIDRGSFAGRVLNKLGLLTWANRLVFRRRLGKLRRQFGRANGGELLIQHPAPVQLTEELVRLDKLVLLKQIGVRLTVLVHDISWFHSDNPNVQDVYSFEKKLFGVADKLIVHNEHMKSYLEEQGFDKDKMVALVIFDYLIDNFPMVDKTFDSARRAQVMIAGGMGGWKASYLEKLHLIETVDWNLCGVEYDPIRIKGDNIYYLGSFNPDEVPFRMRGDFGLVWHGNAVNTCAGRTGEYLKINNPHKLSLYIASCMPVIIWSQAAEADFVREHNLGLAVETLEEVPRLVAGLGRANYKAMVSSVRKVGSKLRCGGFTLEALNA